jgi:hypothetical protein
MLKLILSLSLFLSPVLSWADNVYVVIQKQQEKKKQSRWSLGEWMIQERKIRLMDQWLALNTKEIGSEWRLYYRNTSIERSTSSTDLTGSDLGIEVFYGFLGIGYEQMQVDSSSLLKSTKVKIKLLGSSQQSTHINIFAGLSSSDDVNGEKVNVLGYEGDLYLFSNFGFSARYEEYTASDTNASSYFNGLYRINSFFIESGFIRISYGIFEMDYRRNTNPFKDSGNKVSVDFNF